jgi:hypothetical protein
MLVYVLDRTQSAFEGPGIPPPEYTKIDPDIAADVLNCSTRHVRGIINRLVKREVLAIRCPQDPWSVKALPQNFEKLPVLGAPKRPGRRPNPHQGKMLAPVSLAACKQFVASTPVGPSNDRKTPPAPSGEQQAKIAEMDFLNVRQAFATPSGQSQTITSGADIQSYLEIRNSALVEAAGTAERMGHPDVCNAILEMAARIAENETKTQEMLFQTPANRHQKSTCAREKSNSETEKSASVLANLNFQDSEMDCPKGLGCPYMINGLQNNKPLDLIAINIKPASRPFSPSQAGRPTSAELAAIEVMLTQSEISSLFVNETPGPALLSDIWAGMQGAPLDLLKAKIWKRHQHGYKFDSMGLVKDFAKEVGHRWMADQTDAHNREEQEHIRRLSVMVEEAYQRRAALHSIWFELHALATQNPA